MSQMSENSAVLRRFIDRVWNHADLAAVDELVGDTYTIHSDPGDPWDGQTLTREGLRARIAVSRAPFPDLRFELGEMVAQGDRVAVCWVMHGTQTGAMGERPPTGRTIRANGITIYHFAAGRITGHRQVVDRLAVAQQLGMLGSAG